MSDHMKAISHASTADFSRDGASCYDLFDGQRIEGHAPCTNFTPSVLFRFPCHTHEVERCLKLATEALAAVWGETHHHRFIRARVASR